MEIPPFWILWQYVVMYQREGIEWQIIQEATVND